MSAEQLLYAIGDIRGDFIREAAPGTAVPRRRVRRWAVGLAACFALALLIARAWPSPTYDRPAESEAPADSEPSAENDPSAGSEPPPSTGAGDPGNSEADSCLPSLTVDGVTYVVSGHGISIECPEGFTCAGLAAVSVHDALLPYYTNPERPEWVYVYLNDTYYLPYYTEVPPEDQARYDAVPYAGVLKELPAGFEPVGKTVLDEYDLVPVSELGSNNLPGRQVLANPAEPDILLLRNYWSGLKGPDYWVFVRYQD